MRFTIACCAMALLGVISLGCDNSAPSNPTSPPPDKTMPDSAEPVPSPGSAPGATSAPATQASATPINKFCAVEHENEVDPKVTTIYNGKVIGFCCKDCVPKFKQDPEKYMASLK